MSRKVLSKLTAILLGCILGGLLLHLDPERPEIESLNQEASPKNSSVSSSSPQEQEPEEQDSSIIIFAKVISKNRSQKGRPKEPVPEPSERSGSTSQSTRTGEATLASNGQGTTVFKQTRDITVSDEIMSEFGVWLMNGQRIAGEYISETIFVERSKEYYEAAHPNGRRLKASFSTEMVKAARSVLGGRIEDGLTAYVVLDRSHRQDVANQVQQRAIGENIPSQQVWAHTEKVFLDIQGGSVKVTGVNWK